MCGQPETLRNGKLDLLVNPAVIIEVLSDLNADYDRSGKFVRYRSIDSVRDYLLLDSLGIRAELYFRIETNQWVLTEILDPLGTIKLPSVDTTLAMSELYEDVDLA
ncbi:conserved hypothetical protein [Hymenobacter roseosalivarius DSM 11622]|uniref:Putative restriction endonuclease domain-containing protein n=1 Tax=Hymenobacter roseosalivarius DSM 11622 TaxID=645990 RepID=A0A1W1V9X0_9BACT|nr:Uma2 family endonuclease [Hymenobacter roseosalivarius]SMB90095.1 conserved hypothetical protein [Hymenobacter roseosalivarius DSM 11622]